MDFNATKTFFEATADVWSAREVYQAIDPDDATRVWARYKADYETAIDGEAAVFGSLGPNPTKGDIVADYRNYIRRNLVSAYVKQFDRTEMVSMLRLLARGVGAQASNIEIHLAEGVAVRYNELRCEWNNVHSDEPPINYAMSREGDVF